MFTARILVILYPPITSDAAAETILRACETSARPAGLLFALPHTTCGFLPPLPEDVPLLFYDALHGFNAIASQLTDETHFLCITGEHAFTPQWDSKLLSLWRKQPPNTLFTACCTPAAPDSEYKAYIEGTTIRVPKIDGDRLAALRQLSPALKKRSIVPPQDRPHGILPHLRHVKPAVSAPVSQAHLPALKETLADGQIVIGRGLALVCASRPVKTLVIDPSFLFGPVAFLTGSEPLSMDSLSMNAYLNGYTVLALPEPLAWPLHSLPRRVLQLPQEPLPGTTLSRFEQALGFYSQERQCDPKAAMGLFGHETVYPQHLTGRLMLRQKARSFCMMALEKRMPLLVSAFIDLPNARVASAFYLLRFGFLRRVQSLPITLYTGGSQERALRASFPHTQSYPDNSLLPRALLQSGMKPEEHFARNKTLLMHKAAKRQVEFTHTAWVDMDILPHPVCAEAVPNFDPLMDERIHIATVNGIPDPSFVVVPAELLPPLVRLVRSITQLDAELKRGFSETLLWERVFQAKPQWFAIHPMPRRRLLFITVFDPALLTQSLRPFLKDLPKPYYAALSDVPHSKQTEKETSAHVQ